MVLDEEKDYKGTFSITFFFKYNFLTLFFSMYNTFK